MSEILQSYLEGKIDFEGQKLVEQISRNALFIATVVAFIAGFAMQSLQVLFGVFAVFVVGLSLMEVSMMAHVAYSTVREGSI
ncbi:hypothetical protein GSI_03303 [Ganoderma sinense ZZ0214-1]|uniref:ER membrane protein complex subunit 6 n=1 Tax=Ganoderma sinense ZZ0214-1 TaxID=1077348 RepID=A0A2G8SL82_9APHY|nr:hypothetical protein GSI_03303 [Ganoderma sinense ZZ0214-1]